MPPIGKLRRIVRKDLVKSERHSIGVYGIFNIEDGWKPYVGSASKSVGRRWGDHLNLLRARIHPNIYLQRAWNKYGESAFVFKLIEKCEPENCIAREQYWMDELKAFGLGYNMCRRAGSRFGTKMSAETKAKISAACRGRKASAEARRRMSETRKGMPKSEKTRAKLKENHWSRGEKAEEIAKKIAAGNSGKPQSAERRENISRGKIGRDIPDSEVVSRYLSGESVNFLGTAFKVSNDVIKRKLLNNGVRLRSHRESLRTFHRGPIKTVRPFDMFGE